MKTVLLIEDQEGFRQIYGDILKSGGFRVVEAEDGNEGLKKAKAEKPDLILLDLMLPELHGFEVLKRIRSGEVTRGIPVVILTVLDEPLDREKGIELGAEDFIIKGFYSPRQVLERISLYLK